MAIWPLNRRKSSETDEVPPEVEEYYQSERRERVGMAWLLAFLTLFATIVIALGLFFGGRWVYRKVANKDNKSGTSQTATNNQPQPAANDNPSSSGTSPNPPSSTQPVSTPSTPAPSSNIAPTTPQTPKTQRAQNLANTGPGDTVAIFLAVTIVGALAHQAYARRQLATRK